MTNSLAYADGHHISIAVGIIIGLFASFVQSLGLTIQRKSHVLDQSLPEDQRRIEHRRPLWLLGFAIFISSNILGSIFQIASLPVVILAPLGAVSLLWNAFFARFILGDVFSAWIVIGTILVSGGAVLIATFGIVPEPTRSIEDLLVLFNRPAFIAYFSALGFVLAVCLLITHVTEWSFARRPPLPPLSPPVDPILLPPATNSATGTAHGMTEQTPLLDRKPLASRASSISLRSLTQRINITPSRLPLFLAVSYASASGIVSGMCLLFAKSDIELLLLTIGGDNQFWRWQAWLLLVGLVALALLQVWYLHKALVLADPTIVCPLAFCFYNLSSIVNGLVYFDQFGLIPPHHLLLVALGIIVLLGGVWIVSINSGGGGVDVGTWPETNEAEIEPVFETEDVESGITIPYDRELRQSSREPRSTRVPMERTTASESHAIEYGSHVFPTSDNPLAPFSPDYERQQMEASMTSRSPYGPRTSFSRRRQSTYTEDAQSNSFNALSVGPGFSIGLSPASPGFVIVPRERRWRMGTIDSQERRPFVRRTVSEGDLLQSPPTVSNTSAIVDEHDAPQAKSRWKWAKELFMGRRK